LKATDTTLEERSFSLAEAMAASEAFLTSSSVFLLPITHIDGQKIGSGKPGDFSKQLRQLYLDHAERQASAA
jgi:D-alanine transaminase